MKPTLFRPDPEVLRRCVQLLIAAAACALLVPVSYLLGMTFGAGWESTLRSSSVYVLDRDGLIVTGVFIAGCTVLAGASIVLVIIAAFHFLAGGRAAQVQHGALSN